MSQDQQTFTFSVSATEHLADVVTPVSIFLRVRDRYPNSLLLESADSKGSENSFSFICFDEIASISVSGGRMTRTFPDGTRASEQLSGRAAAVSALEDFRRSFIVKGDAPYTPGIFGHITFDAIEHFEEIALQSQYDPSTDIPEIRYSFYRYVAVVNHFNDRLTLIRYDLEGAEDAADSVEVFEQITRAPIITYPFKRTEPEQSGRTDEEMCEIIKRCQHHIGRGDVFQIVPSRRFSQSFSGDEFLVYRALRSINPSPYLFFFDYGDYRIFGSPPESQLIIKNGKASIFPIAGTYRRTGDEQTDTALAEKLALDEKENAEHVMLVDLARNDLSKHCTGVRVEAYKEAHFYSHVIHLVSKVSGTLKDSASPISIFADTFPMGTVSGAPKYRAMQLIDELEGRRRSFYAGALGFFGLDGSCTHAAVIRSFLSRDRTLFFQAGAGIVYDSVPESEVVEMRSKLGALRRAMEMAETLA